MATFADDFNRADSTNLGAGWVEVSGDWSIVSNQLSPGAAGGTIVLRAAGAMASNDNSAQFTIAATTSASQGVWCRGNTNITSGYLWRNNGTSWDLFSVIGGSFVVLGTYTAAAAPGDLAKVQAVGSTINGYVNGVQRVSVTNTGVTTGTSVGIRADSAAPLRFDDFTGADVATGSTGDAASSSTVALSASGLRAATAAASVSATAGMAATGTRATSAAASITTSASLSAGGQRTAVGDAQLGATASTAAAGQRDTASSADLAAATALSAGGVRGAQSGPGVSASAALAAQGQVARTGSAALSATAVLAADGTTGIPPVLANAALTATLTLTASGTRATGAGSTLTAAVALAAAGAAATTGNSALAVTAALTAGGTTLVSGDDIDVTVGAPYGRWSADDPRGDPYAAAGLLGSDWEVGAPW